MPSDIADAPRHLDSADAKITPEMVEAGESAYFTCPSTIESEIVSHIYRAMHAVRRRIKEAGRTDASQPRDEEIEVTPKMLEAASAALSEHYLGWADGGYDVRDEVMAQVYRAMYAAR